MLRVNGLAKSYNLDLFRDVSFMLGDRDKVGLVGLNGCGKTTLMRILAGLEVADAGVIEIPTPVCYLPQEFSLPEEQLIGEFLERLVDDPINDIYKVKRILGQLGFGDHDDYMYISALSEGQKMKLYMTGLLAQHSDAMQLGQYPLLLLDEPTNHLDIDGIMWFEQFVDRYQGNAIIISHDRSFLNSSVQKIFEIDEGQLNEFVGNYDTYILGKEKWVEMREKQLIHQEKRREKLERLLMNARRIQSGHKRGRAVKAAKKRMEREVLRNEISKYSKVQLEGLNITGKVHSSKKMLDIQGLSFAYETGSEILRQIDLKVLGGEKIWLFGANGTGKTTLIKLLIGSLSSYKGSIEWGENVRWEYFSQDQSHLPMDRSVQEYFLDQTSVSYDRSFGVLEKFLFPKELRTYKLGDLSPGQRARLSFAIFAQNDFEFLILDEPTNHLDIGTKEVIEDALSEFKGNILLISHDRYFVDNVNVDRMITLEDGVLQEEIG